MRKISLLVGVMLLGSLLSGLVRAQTPDMASALVRDTAERMLTALEAQRPELETTPGLIYELVNEIVVPTFDFERITQSAMGRYWRKVDAGQKASMVIEFRQLLVRVYAKALLNYSGQEIRYLPLRPGRRAGEVSVHTEVREAGGPPIPVNYRLYLKSGAWKVYDISIDGVSLIANYRSSFATEIRRKGVDSLIEKLKVRNADGSA